MSHSGRSLAELEVIIEWGLATFIEVGQALLEIRDQKLYREQHRTFEDYCRQRWGFSRVHAHRLMEAANVAEILLPIGNITNESQARELARLKDEEEILEVYRELRDEYGDEHVTAERIRRLVTRRLGREQREAHVSQRHNELHRHDLPPLIDLREGDFRDVLDDIEDSSVDLIITDPLYAKSALALWKDLALFASRVLKPGSLLITYAGQTYLPEVMAALGSVLEYVWLGWSPNQGAYSQIHQLRIRARGKPLLFYSKEDYEPRNWIDDVRYDSGTEKGLHPMQQSLEVACYYIEKLTEPKGLVIDPFVGSGTTAVAALKLGRRWVGAEIDVGTLKRAQQRLAEEYKAFR